VQFSYLAVEGKRQRTGRILHSSLNSGALELHIPQEHDRGQGQERQHYCEYEQDQLGTQRKPARFVIYKEAV
jgi:hypothetical protein